MKAGTPVFAEGVWALFDWLAEESGRRNFAPPVLREQLSVGNGLDELPRCAYGGEGNGAPRHDIRPHVAGEHQ